MTIDSTSRRQSPWPYWLGAAAIGICSAEVAFRLTSGPERYEQFTVGSITWRMTSKHADYALAMGLLAGFAFGWLCLLLVERRVDRRLGWLGVDDLRALIAYASLPFVIWVSSLFIGTPSTRDLVWFSAAAVSVAALLMLIAASRTQPESVSPTPGATAGFVMLVMAFGALSPLIAVLAANRLALPATHQFLWTGTPSAAQLAVSGSLLGLVLSLWAWRRGMLVSSRGLRALLVSAQLLLPWGFLVVMPIPWAAGPFAFYGGPVSGIPWLVFALIGVAYVDLCRRTPVWDRDASVVRRPQEALSPIALAAALLFVKLPAISVQELHADDYHFGEYLLPWWSLTVHGAVPFWDYVPARGLTNYFDSALAAITFGSSAAAVMAAIGVLSALVLTIGLVALSAWIGPLPAAAAFVMLPIHLQLTHVDVLNTAAFIGLLITRLRLGATEWLLLWTLVGTLTFLMAPAQGSILVLATMPLGAWQAVRAFRVERRRALRLGGIAAVLAGLLLLVTPLGRMIVGALRYASEHSAVSGPAHGIEWTASAGSFPSLNSWLFEAVRASWLVVGMCAIALLLSAWIRKDGERGRALVLVAVPVIVMALLFVYRAAGRIDPASVSRLGVVSVWMVGMMLPLLLHAAWGARRWPIILTLSVAGSGLIAPQLGGLLSLDAIGRRAIESNALPSELFRGVSTDLANIGEVGMAARGRVVGIHAELEVLLDPDETYLDLTNRNAQYFYLGREVPIESGAIYNLPNDRQQLRAIERLEAQQVPVVLALGDSQVHDGASPSYRVHTIYRYLIWRYVPVRIGERIYLVKPERLLRLDRQTLPVTREAPAALLDDVFRWPDLQGLPASWGASWPTLVRQVSQVRQLGEPAELRRVGEGSSRGWDLSPWTLAGKDAGMLTFDFACHDGAKDIPLEVRWAAPGAAPDPMTTVRFLAAPRVAVPLDAAPRWLLAPAIGLLEIHVADPATCRSFSLSNATLWQRHVAAATDAG